MRESLEDQNHETIKAHILNPEFSPLPPELQDKMDRIVSAAKLLEKNPVKKNAAALLMKLYPGISRATAFRDLSLAASVFSTYHNFEYDIWQNWLLNDIVETITKCTKDGSLQALKIRTAAQANLIKALGEKPTDIEDINRHEKTKYVIMVNIGNKEKVPIDLDNIQKLPDATLRELNKVLFSGSDIQDAEILDIMES